MSVLLQVELSLSHSLYIHVVLEITLEPASGFLEVCINSSLKITCTTTSDLVWLYMPDQENYTNADVREYTSTSTIPGEYMASDFVFRLESKNPLTSTATLADIKPSNDGNILKCGTKLTDLDAADNITILVKGK